MAEKATIEYQAVNGDTKLLYDETVEAASSININPHHSVDDLILIDGDAKAIYVHRANLVSITIDKTD